MSEKAVIAIDLGGTRIKLGIVRSGKILIEKEMDSQSQHGLTGRLGQVETTVDQMLAEIQLMASSVAHVGIAVPGIVDTDNCRVLSINHKYSDVTRISLTDWVQEKWSLPLYLENDSRAALLGEWKYGNARGYENVAMMMLGTGVGTAAIMDGRILRGRHFQAGILGGHFVINIDGNRCNCGSVGCAEAEASTWALADMIRKAPYFSQSLLFKAEELDFKTIFHLASQGDVLAKSIRDRCLNAWAVCALNLVQAYDPEALILGGGVMGSKGLIIAAIQEKLDHNSWASWGRVTVLPASLINSAALLGVSTLQDHI